MTRARHRLRRALSLNKDAAYKPRTGIERNGGQLTVYIGVCVRSCAWQALSGPQWICAGRTPITAQLRGR